MKKAYYKKSIFAGAIATTFLFALVSQSAPAAKKDSNLDTNTETVMRSAPPFRTNIGLQLSIGGSSCMAGGTNYASCNDVDNAWDAGFAFSGGLLTRPFNKVSISLDFMLMKMLNHQDTANKWNDFLIGPVVRYHHPVKIRKLYLEPNIGLQVGYVRGIFKQAKQINGSRNVNYEHRHTGTFLAAVVGLDFFPLPKVAIGFDLRVVRTLYAEVCFESSNSVACRGINDKAVVERYDLTHGSLPSEMGISEYPWKLFFGVHGLYYF